jgi:hypothetical protein
MTDHATEPVEVGDIVQLDPEQTANDQFAGCLMVVTEVKVWGVQGYVRVPGKTIGGNAYYRASFGTFAHTGGKAKWISE